MKPEQIGSTADAGRTDAGRTDAGRTDAERQAMMPRPPVNALQTKEDRWRLEQSWTIGGSSAAAVVGRARFKTRGELWDQIRRARFELQVRKRRPSYDMNRGTVFEGVAVALLSERLGVPIIRHDQNDFCYHPSYPWAHALPDGWCANDIVEVKVPRPATVARCNLEGLFAEWVIQAQHNMAVCGGPARPYPLRCHVGLLDPMTGVLHDFIVARDDVFIGRIMEAERLFMESVLANERPAEEKAQAQEARPADGVRFLDDPESATLAETWLRLKDLESDLAESLAATRARIQAKMEDAECAEIGSVARVWWKMSKPARTLHRENVLAKYPAIETDPECWRTSKPSRPFRVVPLGS